MGYVSRQFGRLRHEPRMSIDAGRERVAVEPSQQVSWADICASATLVMTPSGGPIRTIVTGRRHITTGSYPSIKAGRPCPFEGMNERAFLMHSEVDTGVVDYSAQPFRFEFIIDGRKRTYIVDCARVLDDGGIEVVEVKNDRRALKDPDYSLKLECVAEICRQLGWRFRVVFGKDLLRPEIHFDAIQDIQSWRFAAYEDADVFRIAERLHAVEVECLGALAERIGSRAVGRAKLKAMMVGRLVRINLAAPLCDESPVMLLAGPTSQLEGWK